MEEASPSYIMMTYYQKSKNFLYPILGYRRNEAFRCQSYLLFADHGIDQGELITHYVHEGGQLYKNFELTSIAEHPLLRQCYRVSNGSVYVFDISGHHNDIEKFLRGEYSMLSNSLKRKILQYMGDTMDISVAKPGRPNHAVLYPDLYRDLVAKDLRVPARNLTELAPIYDADKETLSIDQYVVCGSEFTTPI